MSNVVLPPNLPGAGSQPAGPIGVPGTITSPPPDLSRYPPGHVIKGVTLGRDGHGHLLVKTELGVLAVATKASPPPGSEVTLQIRSSGPQLHVMLLRIDTQPHHPEGAAPLATNAASTGASAPPASGDRLTLSQQVQLQVLQLAEPASLAEAARALPPALQRLLSLLANARLTATLVAIEQPATATLPAAVPQGPQRAPQPPALPSTAPAAGTLPHGVAAAPSGEPPSPATATAPNSATPSLGDNAARAAAARYLSPFAGGPQQPSSPSAPQATAGGPVAGAPLASSPSPLPATGAAAGQAYPSPYPLGATVGAAQLARSTATLPSATQITLSPDGTALRLAGEIEIVPSAGRVALATPLGKISLAEGGALAPGTKLVLELPLSRLAQPAEATIQTETARSWGALSEVLRAIAAHGAAELHPVLRALPQPGPRLASDLLFLISALSGGDTTAWPGTAALDALERAGRGDLVRALGADLAQASRNADATAGDWRLLALPFYDGSQLQQLRLYLRRNRQGRDGARRETATRFLLEVELTRLGALQLDGLVQPRRFDLMLRSRRSLPEAWRQDITRIFAEANEAVGNEGEIVFQASNDWRPMDSGNPAGAAPGGLLV